MCFLPNLHFFASPYFDHDAFMHPALHILDAPVLSITIHCYHITIFYQSLELAFGSFIDRHY